MRESLLGLTIPQAGIEDDFVTGLQAWVESANPEERDSRVEAMRRMIEVRSNGSTSLSLDGLRLSSIPERIRDLTALTYLNLDGNQLTTLPESIGGLTALTNLDLYNNQLTALPESIGGLTALTNLNLSHNRLTTLPERIRDLTALTFLNLYGNQLTTLPESIGGLTALTNLSLGFNQLNTLPERIRDLTALKFLNLVGNQLTTIPERIGDLTSLTYLNLYGNPLTPSTALLDGLFELEEKSCKVDYPDQISLEVRRDRASSLQKSRLQQASRTLLLASYDPKSPLSKLDHDVMDEVLKFTTDPRLLSEAEVKAVFEATKEGVKETGMYKRYVEANSTADNQELKTKSVTASPAEVIASKETEERSYKSDYEDSRSSEERSSSHQGDGGAAAEEPRVVGATASRTFLGRVCDSLSSTFRSSSRVYPDSSVRTTTSAAQPLTNKGSKGNKVTPSRD